MHLERGNPGGASREPPVGRATRKEPRLGRVNTKRFRGRFVRQTAERVNFLRDVHCGLLPRLRIPEAVAFIEELRRLFIPDPPRAA